MRSISPRRLWHRSITVPVFSEGSSIVAWMNGSSTTSMLLRRRHLGRAVQVQLGAVGEPGDVLDARGGSDERQVELPFQPLADDVHMEQAEEATAKTEPERSR